MRWQRRISDLMDFLSMMDLRNSVLAWDKELSRKAQLEEENFFAYPIIRSGWMLFKESVPVLKLTILVSKYSDVSQSSLPICELPGGGREVWLFRSAKHEVWEEGLFWLKRGIII